MEATTLIVQSDLDVIVKSSRDEVFVFAENMLTGALRRLFALAEAYPDLKANENMMQFQEELTSTENKVAFARQAFNDAVLNYNNSAQNFPNNVIAGMVNFELASFLEIEAPEKREVILSWST